MHCCRTTPSLQSCANTAIFCHHPVHQTSMPDLAGQTDSGEGNTRPRTFLNSWHSTALNYISDKTEINNVHAWTPAHTCNGNERLWNAAPWKPSCYVTALRRCSGEYRRHTDSEVAQFLTFVSLSADMYSSFGGSTVPLDAKYLSMSVHRIVPTETDCGTARISCINAKRPTNLLHTFYICV